LHDRIRILEDKKIELQTKCYNNKRIISKFSQGQGNLDKLLCTQKTFFNKEEIGYHYSNKKKSCVNFFVKPALHKKDTETSKIVYIAYACPLRKSFSKIVQIWVLKGTRPPNLVASDFESRCHLTKVLM